MKKRLLDLDIIKVISSIMVIMLHVGNVYMRYNYWDGSLLYHYSGMFFSVTCRVCVPLFIMVSGYLYFEMGVCASLKEHYNKTLKRVIIPTIFISLVYILIRMCRDFFLNGTIVLESYISILLRGKAYSHLWYMYMICGLYIIAPLFNGIKNLTKKNQILIGGGGVVDMRYIYCYVYRSALASVIYAISWIFCIGVGYKKIH